MTEPVKLTYPGATVDDLLQFLKQMIDSNQLSITTISLNGYRLTSSGGNFISNSNVNSVDSTVGICVINGGQTGWANRIGYAGKPTGTDITPIGWDVDSGYPGGASGVSCIHGGYDHITNQIASTICGGGHNFIKYNNAGHSFIGGGSYNLISAGRSMIGAGQGNAACGTGAFLVIGGGYDNAIADGSYSSILGGSANDINTGSYSLIAGGSRNTVLSGDYSAILGGNLNSLGGSNSCIVGGANNTITSGSWLSIAGGSANTIVAGNYSAILGGRLNSVNGDYSFALGRRAKANGSGVLAFSDSTDSDFTVSTTNMFGARFAGGYWLSGGNVGIGTNVGSLPAKKVHIKTNEQGVDSAGLRIDNGGTVGNQAAIELFSPNSVSTSPLRSGRLYAAFDGSSYANSRLTLQSMLPGDVAADTLTLKNACVGIGTTNPAATAILDIQSTTQGFLPPRMTTEQRDAITTPAEGLMIFNSTTKKLNFYNGTAWETVTSEVV